MRQDSTKIVRDTRLEEFKRIEHLLYGNNYEVWFNLYGPAEPELGLTGTLKRLISKDCEVSGVVPSTPNEAMSEIMDMVLYKGYTGLGLRNPLMILIKIIKLR